MPSASFQERNKGGGLQNTQKDATATQVNIFTSPVSVRTPSMDFFKSVFSDEPDSARSESDPHSPESADENSDNPPVRDGGGWSFGGMIRTLTTKSESVIETYRRDLREFGSGLRKEIEVAHGSLENVGQAIDELGSSVLKGTAQIISHGKESVLAIDQESDSADNNVNRSISQHSLNSKPYSRFDAQVFAIQGDVSTYCEEPEDSEEYRKWKLGFVLEEKREESRSLIEENGAVESVYKRVVPNSVDEQTFWSRYYYRVYKLKQDEDLRANLVRRAISTEEEDLSWDVDDDDEVIEKQEKKIVKDSGFKENESSSSKKHTEIEDINQVKAVDNEGCETEIGSGGCVTSGGDNVVSEKLESEKSKEQNLFKSDEEVGVKVKGDNGESCKDSEFSVVSSHQSMAEEEDLGWDEIEDLSSIDEKRPTGQTGSPNKIDIQKRLSVAEEEEDLSWDIEDEDDDEPTKA
ncbi:hypothetical protein K2173_003047 [Erythroxylum novogranatense]|uniref:BSD domain-containing protein n=1 Tax=Erythroxylum novogranatense TaxID=1862640 RepID=A0AAV8S8Q1_9ROSI|nr:hypothetical protein K2173_003047 [Erythroxylum novogranatense]